MARVIRETRGEAESGDWLARLRRLHDHQPGPAVCADKLLRELRDQEQEPPAIGFYLDTCLLMPLFHNDAGHAATEAWPAAGCRAMPAWA